MIEVKNVGLKFRLYHEKYTTLKEYIFHFLFKKEKCYEDFWALRNINFSIEKGEVLGIIGENGSGKSSLLKLIAGIYLPTCGNIIKQDKVSALIELGAGFQPELTGIENIFLNGSLLGFSKKEMQKKLDKIISFAELEHFIDIPIQNYSSGMYMRLGFAIATEVDTNILLIDEILAVGDEGFQKKCFQRIADFKKKGKTIIFVSHDLSSIEKICDRVILFHKGEMIFDGEPVKSISKYRKLLYGYEKEKEVVNLGVNRQGSGEIKIEEVILLNKKRKVCKNFRTGDMLTISMKYQSSEFIKKPVFGLAIYREDGLQINGPNTKFSDCIINEIKNNGFVECTFPSFPLLPGHYLITVAVFDYSCEHPFDFHEKLYDFYIISGATSEKYGVIDIPVEWKYSE
ncbi:MAG: ABC transporter ATP-binding protein [bacterium]